MGYGWFMVSKRAQMANFSRIEQRNCSIGEGLWDRLKDSSKGE